MATLHQFKADLSSCRYIFKSGKIAQFEGGWYRTSIESEIKELNEQIAEGIGSIFLVPGEETIDSEMIDPMAVLKAKIIADYEAEKARSLDNGVSFSQQGKVVPASTKTVAAISADSLSGIGTIQMPASASKGK